ncbi:MAG: hypothetical protein M3335_11400 [Actinomycetota bacterium]|nr:hypothetical protein [Actinomycetota bacterium]
MPGARIPSQVSNEAVQKAVLDLLLDHHPTLLTHAELAREMIGDSNSFLERDEVANAVRALQGAGLLHKHRFLIPTRAALHFAMLAQG